MEDTNLQRISDFAYVWCDLATYKIFQGQMDILSAVTYLQQNDNYNTGAEHVFRKLSSYSN